MQFPDSRILIFAKAPEPGRVKTRLIPALGATGAAQLQRGLLRHTVRRVAEAGLCPVELWCAPTTGHAAFQALADDYAVELQGQRGADLGERMSHAARSALTRARRVLLIGTDCPLLTPDYLCRALARLERSELVFGPAQDGGYVLLGLRRCHQLLFSDMPWGTAQVMAVSRRRLADQGVAFAELETLWDLDRPADWGRLCREQPLLVSRLGLSGNPPGN